MTDTNIMTKTEVTNLFSDEITLKDFKNLKEKVNSRVNYIVHKIADMTHVEVVWYDYDNLSDEKPGEFISEEYSSYIGYKSQIFNRLHSLESNFSKYNKCFPIEWLYVNFENNLHKEIDNYILQEKTAAQSEKAFKLQKNIEEQQMLISIFEKIDIREKTFLLGILPQHLVAQLKRVNVENYTEKLFNQFSKIGVVELQKSGVDITESNMPFIFKWLAKRLDSELVLNKKDKKQIMGNVREKIKSSYF